MRKVSKELDKVVALTDEEEPLKKENNRVRTVQPPPPELPNPNPFAMAGEITTVEPRVAAKSRAATDSCAMPRAAAEMASSEPHPTENQEDVQTRGGTTKVCVK